MLFIGLGLAVCLLIALGCHEVRSVRREALLALRQRATRERQHRQDRLSRIVHGAHDAWWELDLVNHSAYSSDRWRGMAGLEAGPRAPGVRRRAIHPEDRERVCLELQAQVADPACIRYASRFRQVRRDGSSVPVEARGSIERDPAGCPLRMVGSTVDTSDSSILERVRDQAASRRKPRAQHQGPAVDRLLSARVSTSVGCGPLQ